jgi:hypothetical protein
VRPRVCQKLSKFGRKVFLVNDLITHN